MEIATAKIVFKRSATHIAYIVVKDAIAQTCCRLIVFGAAQVDALEGIGVVGGVVVEPASVARHVVSGIEIDVSVAQFAAHTCQDFKQLPVGHRLVHGGRVLGIYGLPVQPIGCGLLFEEAVVLVEGFPTGLKGALACGIGQVFGDATAQDAHCCHQQAQRNSRSVRTYPMMKW